MTRPTPKSLAKFCADVAAIPASDQGTLATVARMLVCEIDALTQERDEALAEAARLLACCADIPSRVGAGEEGVE